MGNKYKVVESGTIICACGGNVALNSSVKGVVIGGEKPLYLKDLLGAPVSCPLSKNPCTKVASISTAGTETNVSDSGKTYLLRTDGFKTDKGRAVILQSPGQTTTKVSVPPSVENDEVKPEDPIEKEERKDKEKRIDEKYGIYLLRKSQDTYKPLRPSRAFRKVNDYVSNKKSYVEIPSVYTHCLAYLYVYDSKGRREYKIFSTGTIFSETIKEVFFQNTQTNVMRADIPLYDDAKVDIYYSNIRIKDDCRCRASWIS